MNIFKRFKIKKGFSLMEILVVLFIVSTTLIGIVSLIIQNIQVQSINKNNLIASSLAQEGLELIRQVRDDNWQKSRAFNYYIWDGSYVIDYKNPIPVNTSDASMAKLYIMDGLYINNIHHETNVTPTIFSRQIFTSRLVSVGTPIQVRSVVTWIDHNRPYRYELQTLLFDWR
jgi:type II secretory pathway pseudopilin PulG